MNNPQNTGNGTAALRELETLSKTPLIFDEYAALFTNHEGRNWANSLTEDTRNLMIDMIAVRTKIFDDFTIGYVKGKHPFDERVSISIANTDGFTKPFTTLKYPQKHQVVVVGSGFDSRALRIKELSNSLVFEIDYPEVIALKKEIFYRNDFKSICKSHKFISLDINELDLASRLLSNDFDVNIPTLWILEAVTGYLTEAVNKLLLKQIYSISALRSVILATFIGESGKAYGEENKKSNNHIFFTNSGNRILMSKNWFAAQKRIFQFAMFYGRNDYLYNYDYWIAYAQHLKF